MENSIDGWVKKQANHYKTVENQHEPLREENIIKLLKKLENVKTITEVACAGGFLTKRLQDMGYSIIGLDLPEVVAKAKTTFPDCNFKNFNAEMDNINEADVIVAAEIVEHLANDFSFLMRCAVAKHIIITIPNNPTIESGDHHIRYYPRFSMEKLLDLAGFEVVEYLVDSSSQFFLGKKRSSPVVNENI